MSSELDRFQAALRSSGELRDGLKSAASMEDGVAFAAAHGFHFSTAELGDWGRTKLAGELSSADLDAVVGGQQTPTGTTGGGNVSVWAKIKSLAFGVDASFF